jgi:hypothetical protein
MSDLSIKNRDFFRDEKIKIIKELRTENNELEKKNAKLIKNLEYLKTVSFPEITTSYEDKIRKLEKEIEILKNKNLELKNMSISIVKTFKKDNENLKRRITLKNQNKGLEKTNTTMLDMLYKDNVRLKKENERLSKQETLNSLVEKLIKTSEGEERKESILILKWIFEKFGIKNSSLVMKVKGVIEGVTNFRDCEEKTYEERREEDLKKLDKIVNDILKSKNNADEDIKKAIENSLEAFEIAKKIYGNDHVEIFDRLSGLGSIYCLADYDKKENLIKSLDRYKEAFKISKKIEISHEKIIDFIKKMGDLHVKIGRFLKNYKDKKNYKKNSKRKEYVRFKNKIVAFIPIEEWCFLDKTSNQYPSIFEKIGKKYIKKVHQGLPKHFLKNLEEALKYVGDSSN